MVECSGDGEVKHVFRDVFDFRFELAFRVVFSRDSIDGGEVARGPGRSVGVSRDIPVRTADGDLIATGKEPLLFGNLVAARSDCSTSLREGTGGGDEHDIAAIERFALEGDRPGNSTAAVVSGTAARESGREQEYDEQQATISGVHNGDFGTWSWVFLTTRRA